MSDRWYAEAVVYCLDVDSFADSDGDGCGDIRGLIGRLDYLARLGIDCLWLNPIHPSPGADDGYDVSDFYQVDPRFGTLGDFAELLSQAGNRGIKVIIDLVVNHTSDKHPWFQSARSSPDSPYRDWFVWSETEPADRDQGMVFPGEQDETWSYDRTAKLWYYHRFYKFQPDLNIENPAVRAEIKKICAFWLQLGVAGFRMDAVPFIIEKTEPGNPSSPMDFDFLSDLCQHDEIDLSRLTAEQRKDVVDAFGPEDHMQLYGRGIRRRLAPMLGNDRRRLEVAYALRFSLRGTPVVRYGEEIGMGEDLSQDGRYAIRTPMQWNSLPNGGFSAADPKDVIRQRNHAFPAQSEHRSMPGRPQ